MMGGYRMVHDETGWDKTGHSGTEWDVMGGDRMEHDGTGQGGT